MDVRKHVEMFVWKIFLKHELVLHFKEKHTHTKPSLGIVGTVVLLFHLLSIVINNLLEMISCSSLFLLTEVRSLVHRSCKTSGTE